eukprot:ANDGO_07244.mRNA.1 hypothetical protein
MSDPAMLSPASAASDTFSRLLSLSKLLPQILACTRHDEVVTNSLRRDVLIPLDNLLNGQSAGVAFFGITNAGKSFLLNALFGEPKLLPISDDRSATTHVPVALFRQEILDSQGQVSEKYFLELDFFSVDQVMKDLFLAARVVLTKELKEYVKKQSSGSAYAETAAWKRWGDTDFQDADGKPILNFHVDADYLRGLLRRLLGDSWQDVVFGSLCDDDCEVPSFPQLQRQVDAFKHQRFYEYRDGLDIESASSVLAELVRGENSEYSRNVPIEALFLQKITVRGRFDRALVPHGMCLIDMPGTGDKHFLGHYAIANVLRTVHRAAFVMKYSQSSDDVHISSLVEFLRRPDRSDLLANLVVVKVLERSDVPDNDIDPVEQRSRVKLCDKLGVQLNESLFCTVNALFRLAKDNLVPESIFSKTVLDDVNWRLSRNDDHIHRVVRMVPLMSALNSSFNPRLTEILEYCERAVTKLQSLLRAFKMLDSKKDVEFRASMTDLRKATRQQFCANLEASFFKYCEHVFTNKLRFNPLSESSICNTWSAIFAMPGLLEVLFRGTDERLSPLVIDVANFHKEYTRAWFAFIEEWLSTQFGVLVKLSLHSDSIISHDAFLFFSNQIANLLDVTIATARQVVQMDLKSQFHKDDVDIRRRGVQAFFDFLSTPQTSPFSQIVYNHFEFSASEFTSRVLFSLQNVVPDYVNLIEILEKLLDFGEPLSVWEASLKRAIDSIKPGCLVMDEDWERCHRFARSILAFRGPHRKKVYSSYFLLRHLLKLDLGFEKYRSYFLPAKGLRKIPSISKSDEDYVLRERMLQLERENSGVVPSNRVLFAYDGSSLTVRPSTFITKESYLEDFFVEHGHCFKVGDADYFIRSFGFQKDGTLSVKNVTPCIGREAGAALLHSISFSFKELYGVELITYSKAPRIALDVPDVSPKFVPQAGHSAGNSRQIAGSIVDHFPHCARIDANSGADIATVGGFVSLGGTQDIIYAVTAGHVLRPLDQILGLSSAVSRVFSVMMNGKVSTPTRKAKAESSTVLIAQCCISLSDAFHFCLTDQKVHLYGVEHTVEVQASSVKSHKLLHDFAFVPIPMEYHDFILPFVFQIRDLESRKAVSEPYWPSESAADVLQRDLRYLQEDRGCKVVCCKTGITTGTTLAVLQVISADDIDHPPGLELYPFVSPPCKACRKREDKTKGCIPAAGDSGAVWVIDRVLDANFRKNTEYTDLLRGVIVGLHSLGSEDKFVQSAQDVLAYAYPVWTMIGEVLRMQKLSGGNAAGSVLWPKGNTDPNLLLPRSATEAADDPF